MANPVHFVLNGVDLPPPPRAELQPIRTVVLTVGGQELFAKRLSCHFTDDPSLVSWDKFAARFVSSANSGWVDRAFAQQLWNWYLNKSTISVSTNTTIVELNNHDMLFNYGISSPLSLVKAVPDGSYWKYDISLVSA